MTSKPHSSWREAFDVVEEAAMGGAEAHTGPSDISVSDYERKVVKALAEVAGLIEQLEALRRGLEIIASKTYPATYVGINEYGVKMYGSYDDASNFARQVLDSNPASSRPGIGDVDYWHGSNQESRPDVR